MIIKSVTITEEQNEWLKAHKEISLSGLVQKTIEEIKKKQEQN